jgi:hypothetical protein
MFLDNEVAMTMELIFSRVAYALAMSRSTSGAVSRLRTLRQGNNLGLAPDVAKQIGDVYSNAAIRLLKLKNAWNLISVSLDFDS